jgi:hypothetical protein
MNAITTNDVSQIYCKDRGAGRPNVFSRGLPLIANAWESQTKKAKNNIPRHVGFIPDGNRRWATDHRLSREAGYAHGINPGLLLCEKCEELGIEEVSIYGFADHFQLCCHTCNGNPAHRILLPFLSETILLI